SRPTWVLWWPWGGGAACGSVAEGRILGQGHLDARDGQVGRRGAVAGDVDAGGRAGVVAEVDLVALVTAGGVHHTQRAGAGDVGEGAAEAARVEVAVVTGEHHVDAAGDLVHVRLRLGQGRQAE